MPTLTTRLGTYGKGSALSHAEMDANWKRPVTSVTSTPLTLTEAHNRNIIECGTGSGTLALTAAATLAAIDTEDWFVDIVNTTSSAITIDPNGSETIDGATTYTIAPEGSVRVFLNAAKTGFRTFGTLTFASATVGSVSGTTIDITDIPSRAKRVTVILSGISTTGASGYKMLLGDSGGFETSGYTSRHGFFNTASQSVAASTDGFLGYHSGSAADTSIQRWVFENVGGNAWVATMVGSDSDISMCYTAGYKALSDTLTQIRLTTVSGDTFDSGSVYAFYE